MTIEPMEIIRPPWLSLNPIARIRGARIGMMIMAARVESTGSFIAPTFSFPQNVLETLTYQ